MSPLSARERRQMREELREKRAFAARQAQQRAAALAAHREAEVAAFGSAQNALTTPISCPLETAEAASSLCCFSRR